MAPVTLPPSFYNSFWSPDYRTGLDVLFGQLESGVIENSDIAAFIESQARAHHNLAAALLEPPLNANRQSTSSLQHTLLSLKGASSARGEAHRALALELQEHVLLPFNGWRARHEGRIEDARDEFLAKGGVVSTWEKEVQRLMGLRQAYAAKSRAADDSEDEAKFAGAAATQLAPPDSYTASPPPKHSPLKRSGTVADRITEKLRAAHIRNGSVTDDKDLPPAPGGAGAEPASPSPLARLRPVDPVADTDSPSSPKEDAFIPPTDPDGLPLLSAEFVPPVPGKDGESPLSPRRDPREQPLLLSGLSLTAKGLGQLLGKFDHYLNTHPAPGTLVDNDLPTTRQALASRQHSTIIGTYEKTFTGEEVVTWLQNNIEGFGGEWDRCLDAAGELQRMGHFSRTGVGRGFDPSDDTYYTLRLVPDNSSLPNLPTSLTNSVRDLNIQTSSLTSQVTSQVTATTSSAAAHIPTWAKNYLGGIGSANSDDPPYVRLRREAAKADQAYHDGVRETETKRLQMEEKIERGLRVWERWERERLGVVRTVLKHYEDTLAKLPKRLADLQEGTALAVEAYNPEADLKALIEGSRTGPFRPRPHIYESVEGDVPDVNFGIDLRRWAGDGAWKQIVAEPKRAKDAIPDILDGLLTGIKDLGAEVNDDERRKAWIYEVPLEELHALRGAINNSKLSAEDITETSKKFNLPIAAGTLKLWLLELNPPVLGWEGWEDAKAIYPSVGADQERDMSSAVTSVLNRLPAPQLFSLNAVVRHLKDLITSTKSEKDDDKTYTTKLALSIGRSLLRPQYETELTIQDRTPSLFLVDLLEHYDSVFPALLEKKKTQQELVLPQRKRTALVDQRISRSRLSESTDPQELLQQQRAHQSQRGAEEEVPPVPPLPKTEEPAHVAEPTPAAEPATEEPTTTPVIAEPTPVVAAAGETRPETPPIARKTPSPAARSPAAAAATTEDEPIAGSLGGLKRNTSAETSRLRGPRGARGPRAAPSHASKGSVSQIAAQFDSK